MKVMRGVVASIGLMAAVALVPGEAAAADEVSCAEQYYACLNEASQKDGFRARTWAEQMCNYAWYNCVKRQITGT